MYNEYSDTNRAYKSLCTEFYDLTKPLASKEEVEVGFITLKRVNIGGAKERIEIKLVDDSKGA